jgi:serine/threonine-protein kinase
MGEVYLAQHPRLPRRDALKIVGNEVSADEDYRNRFVLEADLAAALWHPNIVRVNDRGEFNGQLWIAMDFVDGLDAASLLRDRYPAGMPAEEVATIISAVANALDYAHRHGLLHRDVKPANILLANPEDGEQRILLADFGIARNIGEISGLTATNMAIGTLPYAAPEQLTDEPIDGRADQYALAATAYHLLTGSPLFPHSNPAVVISRHLSTPPPPLANTHRELAALDPVLAVALAKDPANRFANCTDFARAFAEAARSAGHATASAATMQAPSASRPPGSPAVLPAPADPTQRRPLPDGPNPQSPKRSHTGRLIAFSSVGAIVAIVAVVAAIALANSGSSHARSTRPTPSALPNTGPFTGTFTVDMGPEMQADGTPATGEGTAKFSETWQLRSACNANGCVATASAGGTYPGKELVFDNVGGRWLAVTTSRNGCGTRQDDEKWSVISLQPQPDGTLSGDGTEIAVSGCFDKRSVVFTRTADADISLLPDPAALPPRVASPAEALHGTYDERVTFASGGTRSYRSGVRTDCLRTGDRCTSFFIDLKTGRSEGFVFGNGTWTRNEEFEAECSNGGTDHSKFTSTLTLPQPPQDPITLLTGHGYVENQPPAKCPSQAFDMKFTRTGD